MKEYECALTGLTVEGAEPDTHTKDDDLPVGWTKITMVRRAYSPTYILMQQVKDRMIRGLMAQLPPEIQQAEEMSIRFQVEAQFASLEANTPRYERDIEETIYLSDSGDVLESLNEARELLGLEKLVYEEQDEEEEGEDEEAAEDAAPGDGPAAG